MSLIILIKLTIFLPFWCALIYDFYRMKDYYDELMDIFEHLDQKTLIADIVRKPSFYSGQVFYYVLKDATKVMNDRISSLKKEQNEYHKYIELWVHEVKTPITAIQLILANQTLPSNLDIRAEVSKIEDYVEQALYYARSNTLNQDYKIHTFTLESVVRESIRLSSLSIIRAEGMIDIVKLRSSVTSDSKWLVFILRQLIDNSIKYRCDPLKITFSEERMNNGVILLINDNGIGITESDIERVFDKGFTGINGRRYTSSTGMGLYLCKILCHKLGLLIQASPKSNGTSIKIFFPNRPKIFDE